MASAGRTVRRAGAAASRKEILDAAAQLFSRRGYADTSLRDLAAAIGMQAGSLYYHFPSKEALATEVLRIGVDRVAETVRERLAALGAGAGPRERVRVAIRAHLDTLLVASDYTSAHIRCFPYAPEAVRRELRQARREYERIWIELIEDCAPGGAGDPERARYVRLAILGALNWSLEWFYPRRDDAAAFAAVAEALLAGLDTSGGGAGARHA